MVLRLQHDKIITSIDWAPQSNRIVTASQDRNAYVWQETADPETGKLVWKPTLVLLRINRAATYVRWSPKEDKFAVASGARCVSLLLSLVYSMEILAYASWTERSPSARSTRRTTGGSPSSSRNPSGRLYFLSTGIPITCSLPLGAPISKRVCSLRTLRRSMRGVLARPRIHPTNLNGRCSRPAPTVWGSKLPFNTICGEYSSPSGGWVHTVGFSPSGDALAFASTPIHFTFIYSRTDHSAGQVMTALSASSTLKARPSTVSAFRPSPSCP